MLNFLLGCIRYIYRKITNIKNRINNYFDPPPLPTLEQHNQDVKRHWESSNHKPLTKEQIKSQYHQDSRIAERLASHNNVI